MTTTPLRVRMLVVMMIASTVVDAFVPIVPFSSASDLMTAHAVMTSDPVWASSTEVLSAFEGIKGPLQSYADIW